MRFGFGLGAGSCLAGMSSWWEIDEMIGKYLYTSCVFIPLFMKLMHRLDTMQTRIVFKCCTADPGG